MKEDQGTLNCYTKLFPKWIAIIVLVVGVGVAFFVPPSSLVFYFWIGICGLLIYKTLSQKPEIVPFISLERNGIKLSDKKFYEYKNIEKVMAYSKNKFKFRSLTFKLYLENGTQIEFPVDNLDIKPQKLLDAINAKIK